MSAQKSSGPPKAQPPRQKGKGGSRKVVEYSSDNEIDTKNLDTSLLDKIGACPDEGTVLRRVDDWIADLEGKYAGRSVHEDPTSPERTASVYELDPVVVKHKVRQHMNDIPFPSWDGRDDVVVRAKTPAVTVHYHDYSQDLHSADNEPEDEDQDDRDAGARMVRAYNNSCLKQSKTALQPLIDALSRRKEEKLVLANCSMADGGVIAAGPYIGHLAGLHHLDLSANMIFDEGGTALAKALKSCATLSTLLLDGNKLGTYGATALAEQFKTKKSNLAFLSVRHNQLSDAAISAIVDALATRKNIVKLILGHNAVGQQSCSSLANLLMVNQKLEWLDCHWGHMRQDGAVEFAEALLYATKLKHLDLGWNGFGDLVPCHQIAEALKSKTCSLEFLDLSHNRMNEQSAFLVAGPLEFNKSLSKLVLDGNPVGQSGCRRLMNACLGFKNSLETQEKDDRTVEVSLKDCSFGMVNPSSFDPSEPAGEYVFDMADPYSRLVVRDLLKIEAMGKGQFQRHSVTLDWEPYNLKKMTDFDREADVPDSGEFGFRFVSLRKPPWAGGDTELSQTVFDSLRKHFEDNSKPPPGEHRLGKIPYLQVLITADTVFSYKQAAELIVLLLHSEERVNFLAEIYHKFSEPDGNKRLAKDFLTESEQRQLKLLLGPTAFAFTPNNPTGHHHLDLSTKEERDVGIKILDARNGNQEKIQALNEKMSTRQGGPRDQIEMCWLTASLNGGHLKYERHLQMPRHGILELDFVTLLKPQDIDPKAEAIDDKEWAKFLDDVQDCESLFEAVGEFRELSNTKIFKVKHVTEMLRFVDDKGEMLRSRPNTPDQPGRKRQRTLDIEKYRVEVCVVAFARTLDYYGFFGIYGMYKTQLARSERHQLSERIGSSLLFRLSPG